MWVELKGNFLDHQPNREFLWLFLGEIQAKSLFSCFLWILHFRLICLGFFVNFAEVFCCHFLRQCVWPSVLLVSWCHFPWLQREIQQPRWELQNQCLHLNIWLPITGERSALVQGWGCWLWSSQTHLFPVSYILGLTGSGGQPRAKAFELVPSGIACMEMRSLIAEPQASFFNCSELIPWTRSLRAAGNAGQWCL